MDFKREEDDHVSTIFVPQCWGLGPRGGAGGSWPSPRPTYGGGFCARDAAELPHGSHAWLPRWVQLPLQPQLFLRPELYAPLWHGTFRPLRRSLREPLPVRTF